jgi:DNA primase
VIAVSKILDKIGIVYKDMGTFYRTKCWYHEETKPSMSIHKEGAYFHCFSCGRSGSIFSLLDVFLGLGYIEAVKYLSGIDDGKTLSKEEEAEEFEKFKDIYRKRDPNRPTERIIVQPLLHKAITAHPYLTKRGVLPEEIAEWKMGEVTEKPYIGWIYIPVYQNGKLRNYFLRDTNSSRKRYGKYYRKDILFGLDSATDVDKPLYIVEGIFDMIFLRRTGVQVVAALSNRLDKKQLDKLKRYNKVVIVPDNDENNAGFYLVKNALSLIYETEVGVCILPEGRKDAAECSIRELLFTIRNEVPIINYVINNMCNVNNTTKFN